MTVRLRTTRLALAALALAAGLGPAAAYEDVFGEPVRPHRERIVRRPVRALPPPAIVSGYLPRNNAVPLYNEPPGYPAPAFPWR